MNSLAQEQENEVPNWENVEFAEGLPESLHEQIVEYYKLTPLSKEPPPFVNATQETDDKICIHTPSGEVLDIFVRPFDEKRPSHAEQIPYASKMKITWVTSKHSKRPFILSFGNSAPYHGVSGAYFHAWYNPHVDPESPYAFHDGLEIKALYHLRKATPATQEDPNSSLQLDDGGKGHWNTAAGEHIQHTTRFRFHPFFPQKGR